MPNLFEIATRKPLRFPSAVGQLTTEQLWQLPLTSSVNGKANLNDTAVRIDDERETLGRKSFVDTSASPRRDDLDVMLEIVKHIIATKQNENSAQLAKAARKQQRDILLDAIEQAERRVLGSKTPAQLRAELAALDD